MMKNKIEKIRFVKREGLPETNSSSTHSVVISDKDLNVYNLIIKDNTIRIPKTEGFSWDWEKFNDIITKTQYVCGILLYCTDNGKKYDHSLLEPVIRVFKEFTGKDIVFEWEENPLNDNGKLYYEYPNIDHQGYEDVCNIIKSGDDVIRDFIFSPKSWLFTGNDNSDEPIDFYKVPNIDNLNHPVITASIEFGGTIGRLDKDFFYNIWENDKIYDPYTFYELESIHIVNGVAKSSSMYDKNALSYQLIYKSKSDCKFYAVYTSETIGQGSYDSDRFNEEVSLGKLVEGKDYCKFLIKLRDEEHGELY